MPRPYKATATHLVVLGLVLSLVSLLPFPSALAETSSQDVGAIEEIVVVGTRRAGVTAAEAKSPVTVVSGEHLRGRGGTDMLDLLRDTVPSFSVNAQPIADGATIVRPPNIRNLAADHTLVMVNGKRRHRGAVIAWLVPKASEGCSGPRPVCHPGHCPRAGGGACGWGVGAVRIGCRSGCAEFRAEGR